MESAATGEASTAAAAATTAGSKSIEVRFVTQLGGEWKVTETPFSVPSRLTRHGLSEIVNHLLGRTAPSKKADDGQDEKMGEEDERDNEEDEKSPVPFDFVVAGEFVRSTLGKHLRERGVTTEEGAVTVEYTFAMPEPEDRPAHQHGDWVASICPIRLPTGEDVCASGGYDSRIRVWRGDNTSAVMCAIPKAHGGAVKSICALPAETHSTGFASAGKDSMVRVWRLDVDADTNTATAACEAVLRGHTDGVDSVDVSPDGSRLCSASWDKTIRLWDVSNVVAKGSEEAMRAAAKSGAKKRRAGEGKGKTAIPVAPTVVAAELAATATMEAHTDAVTAVQWPTHVQLISGSHDTTVRLWDASRCANVSTMKGQKAVSCLSYSTENGICASGHHDGIVRLWDPRSGEGAISAKTLHAHKGWVCSVSWHPTKTTVMLTASHDGTVKVWDLRSTTPMHTARGTHDGKVLCAAWWQKSDGAVEILSGGADGKVARRILP